MKKLIRWGKSSLTGLLAVFFCFSTALSQSSPINSSIVYVDDSAFPLIKAYVSLSDQQGFPVTGLSQEDFQASEDGKVISNLKVAPILNEDQPLAIVIALDVSGSVEGKPLKNSIEAAKNFIQTLQPEDKLGLITFSEEVNTYQGLTLDHGSISSILDTVEAKGNTALYDAIGESIDLLKNQPERKVIVLLTDGYDSGIGSLTLDDCVNAANTWSTPIYSIGYGSVDSRMLDRLASLTGGFSQIQPDSTTLSGAFTNVVQNLREQYLVEFTSSFPADASEHDLDVTIDYEGTKLSTSQKFIARTGDIIINFSDIDDNSNVFGKYLFKPEFTSPAPISSFEFWVDDQLIQSVSTPPYEYKWDADSLPYGNHTLKLVATDSAGNSGVREVPVVTVPAFTPNLNDDDFVSGKYTLSAQVEPGANIVKVQYLLDGILLGESSTPPFEFEWNTKTTSPGYHDVKVSATTAEGDVLEKQVKVNVGIQKGSNVVWIALITLLAAAAVFVPIAYRRNKRIRNQNQVMANPPAGQTAGTGAVLNELNGLNPGQTWYLKEITRLGRKSSENDIPLLGLAASRFQGVIRESMGEYILESSNPENPMLLNEQPVINPATLHAGDVIRAGDSTFTFEIIG